MIKSRNYLINLGEQCIAELEQIGIHCGCVRNWSINSRAKRRWGQCKFLTYDTHHELCEYAIEISEWLLRDDTDIQGLKQTIMHELLHTCDGCMNHGKTWKCLADKVNRNLGYNISRLTSCEGVGISNQAVCERDTDHRYKVECIRCHRAWYKDRACKLTKYPSYYRCKCGGNLKVLCNGIEMLQAK